MQSVNAKTDKLQAEIYIAVVGDFYVHHDYFIIAA